MIVAASVSIIKRSEINSRKFIMPVVAGIVGDVLINGLIYTLIIMDYRDFFQARYLIPIIGMVIGNCISNSIIGIRSFYKGVSEGVDRYKYYLACGADRSEAIKPFFAEALRTSFGPTIASNATIGLIWLPGMMTGQILGGSDPMTAIKYQILIVTSIFVGGVVTVFISLSLSKRYAFDNDDNFVTSLIKK
jgi:putative ABC transport system permease protein